MKNIWLVNLLTVCALWTGMAAWGANYYVNDASTEWDVYCTAAGNDAADGTSPGTPKLTTANLLASVSLQPGDTVYVDTGTYDRLLNVPSSISGTNDLPIVFRGSWRGSIINAPSTDYYALSSMGNYLHYTDFILKGAVRGIRVQGNVLKPMHNRFERIQVRGTGTASVWLQYAYENTFANCIFSDAQRGIYMSLLSASNNFENCVIESTDYAIGPGIKSVTGCAIGGPIAAFAAVPEIASNNVFYTKRMYATSKSLHDLQQANEGWGRNTWADPQFMDPLNWDFHVASPMGVLSNQLSAKGYITNQVWVTNAALAYSPVIDFGVKENTAYTNEPMPNGTQVNAGGYGGTGEASKSWPVTEKRLFAMSFNDGGQLRQSGALEWMAWNFGADEEVDVQISTNFGGMWTSLGRVKATNETYTWTVTAAQQHPAVIWRVVSAADATIAATNAKPFGVRASEDAFFTYYINDDSTVNDVYCSAIGNDANSGVSSNAPKRSLQAVVDAYQLEGGDVVYVDTGNYTTNFTTTISPDDGGIEGRMLRVVGSPKGCEFSRGSLGANALDVQSCCIQFENLTFSGSYSGIKLATASNICFVAVTSKDNNYGVDMTGNGTRIQFDRCILQGNKVQGLYFRAAHSDCVWKNGVMWGNEVAIGGVADGLHVENSILGGEGKKLFNSQIPTGDYNVVWDAKVGLTYATFADFQASANGWTNSLYMNPQFADAVAGDYHLKSMFGRYDVLTGTFKTNDTVHSPAIDFGNPADNYSLEPTPNGGRLNAGIYGNTTQASKSRTNAWLQVMSFMDGGSLDAQSGAWLRWTAGNVASNAGATIWLSRDDGASWETVTENISVGAGSYFYQNTSSNDASSLYTRWKISLNETPQVSSQSATNFVYKNGAFSFYVNDGTTEGDVYCTAPGSASNLGVSKAAPMATLAQVLTAYTLSGGDRVFVDTGTYPAQSVAVFTAADSGTATQPVRIIGSTNRLAGGTVMGSKVVVALNGLLVFQPGSSNIIVQNVILTNVQHGVRFENTRSIQLDGVEVRGALQRAFSLTDNARDIRLTHCVAHGGGIGVFGQNVSNVLVQHSVFWENSNAVCAGAKAYMNVENSILASSVPFGKLYSMTNSSSVLLSDYNGLDAGPNTWVGWAGDVKAENLTVWQAHSSNDMHGVAGDPRMADPNAYDYHLKTSRTLGRCQPNGQWTSDEESSPLLDAGNPESACDEESSPSGERANIGKFGNTPESSKAEDGLYLLALSFADGGEVKDGSVTLRWLARGGFSNQTVSVEVSTDGGKTWPYPVAEGISATNELTTWTVAGISDTPAALWRVTCEADTNICAQTETFFAVRNQPLNLFIATSDTNETVYISGPGKADNWAATAETPLNSIRLALEKYDLEAGDTLYVDTGLYEEPDALSFCLKDSGTEEMPVRVVGNTNRPYAATVLKRDFRTKGTYGMQFNCANDIQVEALVLSNAWIGVQLKDSSRISLIQSLLSHVVTNAVFADRGAEVTLTGCRVEQSLYSALRVFTGGVVRVNNSLLRDNALCNVQMQGGAAQVRNSILEADENSRYIYCRETTGTLDADYNNVRVKNGASVAFGWGLVADRFLIDWQRTTGGTNDMHSFGYDADFANEGRADFHLSSAYGRYDPATGGYVTTDTVTSRLIDLGDPEFSCAKEPAPNGGRINVGLYGNTEQASKSSGQGVLVPLTMSDGGTIRGEAKLYWMFNGFVGTERINVLFSGDGGTTWTNIATNLFINSDGVAWSTTNYPSTAMGVWRVELANHPEVFGETETLFAVKNDPLKYYVNDASTNGDVYCSATGSEQHNGLSPETPVRSLADLFGRYKIEPGDTVYVDTGVYESSSGIRISAYTPAATNWLLIQGSTNESAGGTVFSNKTEGGTVLTLENSQNIDLRDIRLHGGNTGLQLEQSTSNRFFHLRSIGARVNAFSLSLRSDQNQFVQCAALNFFKTGFYVVKPLNPIIPPTTNYWDGGVLSSVSASTNGLPVSTGVLVNIQSGRLYCRNSVFVPNEATHDVYLSNESGIHGDYNCYYLPWKKSRLARIETGAIFGSAELSYRDLLSWQNASRQDAHSISSDPLFADLEGGDLHPQSSEGRFSPETGEFVQDGETSPLIDAADPSLAYAQESAPNGGRANIGFYGNHPLASRTPTNGTFVLTTLNDGGVVSGLTELRWIARGPLTNAAQRVVVQLSTNSGHSWMLVSNNISAREGVCMLDTTAYPSVPTARWRVQSQSIATWFAQSEEDFVIHNEGIHYYVNDASTNGDVYCTSEGDDTKDGLTPETPKATLSALLEQYNLEGGDTVYMDTGIYLHAAPCNITFAHSGQLSQPVRIIGSSTPGGTVIHKAGLVLDNVRDIHLSNLRFTEQTMPASVIELAATENVTLEGVDSFGSLVHGVQIVSSSNALLKNFTVAWAATNGVWSMASYNTQLESGTIVSNGEVQVRAQNQFESGFNTNRNHSYVTVTNCILSASGTRKPIYYIKGTLLSDYNNLYVQNGALVTLDASSSLAKEYDSVGTWMNASGQDQHSLSHDPLFADSYARDFHLKSQAGRWTATGWTNDSVTSPLIDAADHSAGYEFEPNPNGERRNLGRYGNTGEASKTPEIPSLTLMSYNDGGRARGTNVPVRWVATGMSLTNTVRILYSADGGGAWVELATGVSANGEIWYWDTSTGEQSVQAKLRIELEGGLAVAETRSVFSVRNQPVQFYINDASTENDVYCTAPGNNANTGLTNSAPMADLNALLEKYDLDSGDTVYIDVGIYAGVSPWQITQADSAGDETNAPVVFQGARLPSGGGTVIDGRGRQVGVLLDYVAGVRLSGLVISNTTESAVSVSFSHQVEVDRILVRAGNVGIRLSRGSLLRVQRCIVLESQCGVSVERWDYATNTVFPRIDNNVIWRTEGPAVSISGDNQATVQNNIFSVAPGYYVYRVGVLDELTADYNAIWLPDGGRVFQRENDLKVSPVPLIYDTLGAWAAASGNDLHSFDGNPQLANTDALDFHLKSQQGRWTGTEWVQDEVSSPLIDAGNPEADVAEEPDPNGRRMNIGLFGGTAEASKTPDVSSINLLTLNRGGVASGQVHLNWMAIGTSTGHTVRVEVSVDDGATWMEVASGLQASLGGIVWNSRQTPSSPIARWRVTDEMEDGVQATSESYFVLHNTGISYYVNDAYTNGDVYCHAVGSGDHTGLTPDSPKRWISEVLDSYNLEGGDVVYVDTGDYLTEVATVWGDLDAGNVSMLQSEQVTLQGSTNVLDGGSRFIISDAMSSGFIFTNTCGIRIRHLDVKGASNGVSIRGGHYLAGDWLNISECDNGVKIQGSSNVVFRHTVIRENRCAGIDYTGWNNNDGVEFASGVLWNNPYGVYLHKGYLLMSNSIAGVQGPGSFAYYLHMDQLPTGIKADYNNLYVMGGGAVAGFQTGSASSARTSTWSSVSAWANDNGQDTHSLAHHPQIVDGERGDFHLKSAGGRYVPETGEWVYDTVSSPLIDAGTPSSMEWTSETDPNGRRLNIGLYGGTAEASRTATDGWITLLALNDGGSVSGKVPLQWSVGGAATNYSVCLEYSPDAGTTWSNIQCGIPALEGQYLWSSEPYGRSARGMWRAYCVENEAIAAMSQRPFVLRNGGSIYYYVNDVYRTNDVYCTASGDDANDGLTPETPKASLQAILDAYELAPEDYVLVDAGEYQAGAPAITVNPDDSGWSNLYVTIQGSTNPTAPTVFHAPSIRTPSVFYLSYADNIRMTHLTVQGAATGILMENSRGCELRYVRVEKNSVTGIDLNGYNENIRLINCIAWANRSATGGVAVTVSQSDTEIINSVLWDSFTAISLRAGGRVEVTNSVLSASGSDGRVYSADVSVDLADFNGDYNVYNRQNGALLAEQALNTGGSEYYNTLPSWMMMNGSDIHSMMDTPLFADTVNGDFHLQSTEGRYSAGEWVKDNEANSPLIDAGDPQMAFNNEPAPNGQTVNIGAYGNTAEASLSRTSRWVRAVSYNDGGIMTSNVLLYWNYGGIEEDSPVRLEYSTDYESTWNVIASNLPIGQREYAWDVRELPLSLALYWRVVLQDDDTLADSIDQPVQVKTRSYDYYVNDESTEGDVYCTAAGQEWWDDLEMGLSPSNPVNGIAVLLAHYPVGGGDRVFVDTGTYVLGDDNQVVLSDQNMGVEGMPLQITGSTNWAAGGTLLTGISDVHDGITVKNTRHIEMENLRITGMNNGIALQNADGIVLRRVELFLNRSNGIAQVASGNFNMENGLFWGNRAFGYLSAGQRGEQSIKNATFYGNKLGAAQNELGSLWVENSILVMTNAEPVFTEKGDGIITGDYNLYQFEGMNLATNVKMMTAYVNLSQWKTAQARDEHSWVGNPLFVEVETTNFHLQSRAGCWSNGAWHAAVGTSWAVDGGNPEDAAWNKEPAPNGARINLGYYGGTESASKTDSSLKELYPLSFRDGGVASYGQAMEWLSRGLSATDRIRIEYSPDSGATWRVVAGGIAFNALPYHWFSQETPTPEALWRVVLEGNAEVYGQTEVPFIFRPSPLVYYVNDNDVTGDVYTTAVGSTTNKGYLPESPLALPQEVLERYTLLSGDSIRIDTGLYMMTNTVLLTGVHSGDATNRVRLVGSTNAAAGGSQIQSGEGMQEPAFMLHGAKFLELSTLHIRGFTNAISFAEGASDCRLENLDISDSWGPGVLIDGKSSGNTMLGVCIRNGETNGIVTARRLDLDGCVLWSNKASAIYIARGDGVFVTNSVLMACGFGNFCYESPTNVLIQSDYNNLYLVENAQVASINGVQYEKLPQWVREVRKDQHSLSTDPLFHDPSTGDFHLRSTCGRYQAADGSSGWTQDVHQVGVADYSPLIDMGSTNSPYADEPQPNGGRRNIGLYGGTEQASKSDTNAWVLAVTAMSGGITYGTVQLVWGYGGNLDPNADVLLEYSYDNGTATWIRIAEAKVGDQQYYWDSTKQQAGRDLWMSSPAARWRLTVIGRTNVWDMTDTHFGLRNNPFTYYLNDESRENDIWSEGIGSDANMGFYPAAPKLTLQALLEEIDLEPTDRVLVDTGVYYLTDTNRPILWEVSDGGLAGQTVVMSGSVHGATFITTNKFSTPYIFRSDANYLDINGIRLVGGPVIFSGENLKVHGVGVSNGAVELLSSRSSFTGMDVARGEVILSGLDNRLEGMRQRFGNTYIRGTNVVLMNSVVYTTNNAATGVVVNAVSAVLSNNTVVASRGSAVAKLGVGNVYLGHNILVAGGTNDNNAVIAWHDGGLFSDWNNLLARDKAWTGIRNGKWERLAYWQTASGQDGHSVAFDPLFQNEGDGDFHLNSRIGRWSPVFNQWDTDGEHSPVIDLGSPNIGTGDEVMPNGYRRNLGAFGGTAQASKSVTNFWVTALSQNDGGVVKGSEVVLRWAVGNAGNRMVVLRYSTDGGTTWTDIATVSASDGEYLWDTTGFGDSFNARWSVVGTDGSAGDTNDTPFNVRNASQVFYVNDESTEGDIYCSRAGSASYTGLSRSQPKLSLQQILDLYDLEPGDTVYVDTGVYSSSNGVRIIWSRSGTDAADVLIVGNTNDLQGTILQTAGIGAQTNLDVKASHLTIKNLMLREADRGILLETNHDVTLSGVLVKDTATGILVLSATNTVIRNSAVWNGGTGVDVRQSRNTTLENTTFALPTVAAVRLDGLGGNSNVIQNNIFIPATNAVVYALNGATSYLARASTLMDYNLYDFGRTNTWFHEDAPEDLRHWQLARSNDFRSAITSADLAEVETWGIDLHPLSAQGRWNGSGWTRDEITSWAVDHGNVNQSFEQEPAENGGRRNIGAYGNTVQASKGTAETAYDVRTLDEEGMILQISDPLWPLVWSSHLVGADEMVHVQFSADSGQTWETLATVPGRQEYIIWRLDEGDMTANGRWRVISTTDPSLTASSQHDFAIQSRPLGFLTVPVRVNGLMQFRWEGGIGGKRYIIRYSDDFGQTWQEWDARYNGPRQIHKSNFIIPAGGAASSYTFEDRTSYLVPQRWYRLFQQDE